MTAVKAVRLILVTRPSGASRLVPLQQPPGELLGYRLIDGWISIAEIGQNAPRQFTDGGIRLGHDGCRPLEFRLDRGDFPDVIAGAALCHYDPVDRYLEL